MRPFCYESPKPVVEELYFVVLSGRVGGHAPTTDASESSTTDKFMYYSRYRLPIQPEQRQAALLVERMGQESPQKPCAAAHTVEPLCSGRIQYSFTC